MPWNKWEYLDGTFPRMNGNRESLFLALQKLERAHPKKARQIVAFRLHYRLYPGENPETTMPYTEVAALLGVSVSGASGMGRAIEELLIDPIFWR